MPPLWSSPACTIFVSAVLVAGQAAGYGISKRERSSGDPAEEALSAQTDP